MGFVLSPLIAIITAWASLALWYRLPVPESIRGLAAGLFILAGIATRKGNAPLHDAIAKAFASMQKDGTYSRILAKWNLQLDEMK